MELYIPPPTQFLPRLPPPRPVVPAVPVVPVGDLPDTIYAPEGAYTLNPSLFPSIGTPSMPLPYETRPMAQPTFIGGAGGFIVPPPNVGPPPTQSAMNFGTTMVNGQPQPSHPVRFSFVNVYFPPKGPNERGLGGLLGMGGGGGGGGNKNDGSGNQGPTSPSSAQQNAPLNMSGYEPSLSSSDDSPNSDPVSHVPIPVEVPLAALPQQSGKKNPWFKTGYIPTTALNALPRPKNNLRSSNSSFVTRLQAADNLPKTISEKGRGGGEMVRWGFWNLGRTFGWGEEGGKAKEPYARVTFAQVPTCHAVSQLTASAERLDIVVGFVSGDIVWLDFITGKYTRINKGGVLNSTAVTHIVFDPRRPQHFVASFADSTILQFNLFADDPPINVSIMVMPWVQYFDKQRESDTVMSPKTAADGASIRTAATGGPSGGQGGTTKSSLIDGQARSDDAPVVLTQGADGEIYEDSMMVWKNEEWALLSQLGEKRKKEDELKAPWAGKNPTAAIRVGRKSITCLAYSPDGKYLAVTSDDGHLRLVDPTEERLTDTFAGYFGPLNCIAWSPDSRFVAVGGQDDLITVFSPKEARVVARCQGHSAFVTSICFDPGRGGGGYRFGSVGEDGKICLWDFSAASLHRPRHHHSNASHHRLSGVQSAGGAHGSTASLAGASRSHLPLNVQVSSTGGRYHPAPPRSEVAELQPVLARVVEGNLLTGIHMSPSAIYTVSRAAQIKIWQRPPRQSAVSRKSSSGGPKVPGGGLASPGVSRERGERIPVA